MPAYHFKALDDRGGVQKGLLEGDSARQVRQQLRDKQWTPVEISAVNDRQSQHKSRYKNPLLMSWRYSHANCLSYWQLVFRLKKL